MIVSWPTSFRRCSRSTPKCHHTRCEDRGLRYRLRAVVSTIDYVTRSYDQVLGDLISRLRNLEDLSLDTSLDEQRGVEEFLQSCFPRRH